MPYQILITILFLFLIMPGVSTAHGQRSPQELQKETPSGPQPEVPKQISTVIVKNNHLSVEFDNVSFGEIILAVSQQAGFRIEGSSKVFNKKLTVKFHNMDIDRGITRLFSLAKESNYLINYDSKGTISRLKIHSIRAVAESDAGSSVPKKTDDSEIRRLRRRQIQRSPNPQLSKDPSL